MSFKLPIVVLTLCFSIFYFGISVNAASVFDDRSSLPTVSNIQVGPRPMFLVDTMKEGALKNKLASCEFGPFEKSDFSIGHRGAPLQFPEHTVESYVAAARMGAGLLECDVSFTKDAELVCRHSQCDLHTTTNILSVPELAGKCSVPFRPAILDTNSGEVVKPATAKCCTSDVTAEEFLTLSGKMDAFDRSAQTVEQYQNVATRYRTDLYAATGTLITHAQSIELFESLNVKMIPELKSPKVSMPFNSDYTQEDYAQHLVDEYKKAKVPADDVWLQSFNLDDVRYWIDQEPDYGRQAVYLDGRYSNKLFDPAVEKSWQPSMDRLKSYGVEYLAPPIWVLLTASKNGEIVPSEYALKAKAAGFKLVPWSLERSGTLTAGGGWYYQSVSDLITREGDVYAVLDVLAKDVGITGIFSDWPATTTYYANCVDM